MLNVLKSAKEDINKARLLINIANEYVEINPSSSILYINRALELSKKLGDEKEEANCYSVLARANIRMDHFKEAEAYYNKAGMLYAKLGKKLGQANVLNGKAVIYIYQEAYDKALESLLKALELFEKPYDKALVFTNVGIVLAKLQRFDEAISYFEKAIALEEGLGPDPGLTRLYCNIGSLLQDKNELDKALIYYNKALEMQKAFGDSMLIVVLKANIGRILVSKAKYEEALLYNAESLEMAKRLNDTSIIVALLNNIGTANLALNNWNKAIEDYESALRLSECLQDKQSIKLIYQSLCGAHKKKGDYAAALRYHEAFYELDTTVFNQEVAANVEQLKEKYEAEKREQDILLLKEQNEASNAVSEKQKWFIGTVCSVAALLLLGLVLIVTINRSQKKQKEIAFIKAKAELEQTALLAQMNPHFIFNALNSIQHYILSKETEYAYDYLAKFSKLIRQVLINSEQTTISLDKEIETLRLYIELEQRRLKNRFDFVINYSEDFPAHDITIHTMLIQPFVENAIWHGLMNIEENKKGKLTLDFSLSGKQLKITVEDNGVGREKAARFRINNEYKSVGVMFTQKRLELIQQMNKQECEIHITDLYDKNGNAIGTRVDIIMEITS